MSTIALKERDVMSWGRSLTKGMEGSEKYQETGGKIRSSWLNLGWLIGFWLEWKVNGNTAIDRKYKERLSWRGSKFTLCYGGFQMTTGHLGQEAGKRRRLKAKNKIKTG